MTFDNPQAQPRSARHERGVVLVVVVMGGGEVLSPRTLSVTFPPPLVGVRIFLFHQEWASIMEKRFMPINLEHQYFLHFELSLTEAYQFWALPFDLSIPLHSSPYQSTLHQAYLRHFRNK